MTEPGGRRWALVAAATVACMCGLNVLPFFTIGAFVGPLSAEFGWSRGAILGLSSANALAAALVSPAIGWLADRHGARRLTLLGYVGLSLPFVALALLPLQLAGFYAAYAALALLGGAASPVTLTRVINGWFDRQRGLALGLVLSGSGLFAFLMLPLLVRIIAAQGWRAGYLFLAALPVLLALPLLALFFRDPPPRAVGTARAHGVGIDMAPRVALRSRQFWIIAVAFFFVTMAVAGVFSSLIPTLTDAGFTPQRAAAAASFFGIAIVVSRIGIGFALDRFWPPGVAAAVLALPTLACVILAGDPPSFTLAALAAFLIGVAAGAEFDLIAYLTARYFGLAHYGKLYALLFVAFSLGGAASPFLFGRSFDLLGSFRPMVMAAGVLLLLGAAGMLLLEPRRMAAGGTTVLGGRRAPDHA